MTHLIEPSGVSEAKQQRIRGAYARCGAVVNPKDHPSGARITCPDCLRLNAEDERGLASLLEDSDGVR